MNSNFVFKEEEENEEEETKMEIYYGSEINPISIPLGEVVIPSFSSKEQMDRLKEQADILKRLPIEIRKSLMISGEFIAEVKMALFRYKYVPDRKRKYFRIFIQEILGESHPDYETLMEIFGKSTIKLPYIRTRYRNRIWIYFKQWEEILLCYSYTKMTPWVYRNSEVTIECDNILKNLKYLYSYSKTNNSNVITVNGRVSEEKFIEDLQSLENGSDLLPSVKYTQLQYSDDVDINIDININKAFLAIA